MSCFVIAEIGVNHNGDLDLAKRLIEAAKGARADAVKFQTFSAERLAIPETPKVTYQKDNCKNEDSHFEMLKSLELSKQNQIELKIFCDALNIEFMSTPYDVKSAEFLHDILKIKRFKTASADLVDATLHRYISKTGKPAIISTGMASLDEIRNTIDIYAHNQKELITLLHCTSNYPCSKSSMNLRVMHTLRDTFGVDIGYSDHSEGNTGAIVATALGATIIEKHMTLDKEMSGPDHKASVEPQELKELIKGIRQTESILGTDEKKIEAEEIEMRSISRKSIRAIHQIKEGDIIEEKDLILLRPGNGLTGNKLDLLVGKRANREIKMHELVTLSDIK